MFTVCPARASSAPHIAPEGPPPTIAMSAILLFSDRVEVRRRGGPARVTPRLLARLPVGHRPKNGQSTDREDNHAKTSEEYSTEDSRRQCAAGAASDNIHTCTLEQAEDREIGCEQGEKDLAVMQADDSDEKNTPHQRAQSEGIGEASFAQSRSHCWAERKFFGGVKWQR